MQSWRNPEDVLATRKHLPHEINFEYIYDGGGKGKGGGDAKHMQALQEEVGREREENRKNRELIKELGTELELIYNRSVMDKSAGGMESEYRTRCHNYEAALKRVREELHQAKAEALKLSKMATDDRRRCIGLQTEAQRSAVVYRLDI
jgi:hypothetical protein